MAFGVIIETFTPPLIAYIHFFGAVVTFFHESLMLLIMLVTGRKMLEYRLNNVQTEKMSSIDFIIWWICGKKDWFSSMLSILIWPPINFSRFKSWSDVIISASWLSPLWERRFHQLFGCICSSSCLFLSVHFVTWGIWSVIHDVSSW